MYCRDCGQKIENGICPKCNGNNKSDVTQNNSSSKSGLIVVKCIFIPLGIAVAIFLATTIVSLVLNLTIPAYESDATPTIKIIKRLLIPFIQITIPLLIIFYGWIVVLIKETLKGKKK